MGKQRLTVSIDYVQPSLNKLLRIHYHTFHKELQRAFEYAMVVLRGKPKFKDKKVRIAYTIYFGNKHKHDYSNYGQKLLDDALVQEGIIDDDSDKVIVEETLRFKYDKKNPRTEIEIEEV